MTQNKNQEALFFDHFVTEKSAEYDVLSERAYRKIITTFQRIAAPRPGQTLIDLGCGTGGFTRRLNFSGLDVLGMDISTLSIERAKQLSSKEKYLVGDISQTGFRANHFDIVVYSGVLHHFPDFTQVLQEGYRIVKPGGQIFTVDPNLGNPCMWLYRSPDSPCYSTKGITSNEKLFTAAHLRQKLAGSRFSAINVFAIGGITYKFVESGLIRILLPLYNLWEILFGLSPFARRYGSFLIGHAVKENSK